MISFTSAELNAWLAMLFFPFVRVLALVATEPVLGSRTVPARVKVGFAALFTLLIVPALPPMPAVEPGSAAGLLIIGQQILIGVAMGFTMRIVFAAVEMAGAIAGMQMGLGFANFFDPQHSAQIPVVGQFYSLILVLVFLAMNGHLMVVSTLAISFQELPVGQSLASGGWRLVASWGGQIFAAGVWMSLPVVAALVITNLAIGVLSRAAPQLNIFAVGFPLTLVAGFALMLLTLPYLLPMLERIIAEGVNTIVEVLRQTRSPN